MKSVRIPKTPYQIDYDSVPGGLQPVVRNAQNGSSPRVAFPEAILFGIMMERIEALEAAVKRLEGGNSPDQATEAPAKEPPKDVNTMSKDELVALPGIGRTTADKIIGLRKDKPFESVEDIVHRTGVSLKDGDREALERLLGV